MHTVSLELSQPCQMHNVVLINIACDIILLSCFPFDQQIPTKHGIYLKL